MKKTGTDMGKGRRKATAVFSGILLVLTLAGCGPQEKAEAKRPYIAVICKAAGQDFWLAAEKGARDAGEELGVRITFETPEDESHIQDQIQMVRNAVDHGADAVVLAPLDAEKLNPVIEEADKKGVRVLTIDSDVTSKKRVATIGTDNRTAGAIAARHAAALIGGSGKVAIVSHVEGSQTATERTEGFTEELKERYGDKIEVVGIRYCGGIAGRAKEEAAEFMEKYPDLRLIYATNEGSATGVGEAIAEAGAEDRVQAIGFDSSENEVQMMEDRAIDGILVQNPYNMGYLGVRYTCKVLQGENVEEKLDTGVSYVDRDNVDDDYSQWLLYPLQENGTETSAGKQD